MTTLTFTPTLARIIIRLPSEFAAAYSPGFDLHVTGSGNTQREAQANLATNLRDLAARLNEDADKLDMAA